MPPRAMSADERTTHVAGKKIDGGPLPTNHRSALAYAARGFRIFPCGPDKRPLVADWLNVASSDTATINAWWTANPAALIGLPVKAIDALVVDCDRHAPGEDGVAAFRQLIAENGDLPPHPVIETPNAGEHHFFAQPQTKIGNRKVAPGIETRGFRHENDGGFVVAAGSVLPDGRRWKTAQDSPRFLASLADGLPQAPPWLIAKLMPQERPAAAKVNGGAAGHDIGKREQAYAEVALRNTADEVASTGLGNRNNALNAAAFKMGTLIARDWIGRATVEGRLHDACAANGLLADDGGQVVTGTIKSGIDAGLKNPHADLVNRPRESTGQAKEKAESKEETPQGDTSQTPSSERSIVAIRADTLKPESISWAWKNRFAFGKMAMLAGDPGLGKSTVLTEIAALHSRGGDFPCKEGTAIQCEIAILTAEDGLRDTLVPRLMAAEADMSKIHFITGTKIEGADGEAMFDLASDVAVLRKYFIANPAIKVLIIDPLTAYLGAGTKAKENTDVRRVLGPLIKLAEDFGLLMLANNHLNKSGGKALYRILDSIAFTALGRIIHLVIEDADNPDQKKLICSKINIGSKPLGLTYIIQKTWIKGEQGEEIETSRISWGTTLIDETADEALGGGDDGPSMAEEAEKFLTDILATGRATVQDIEAMARAAGMLGPTKEIKNSKPFRTACDRLMIVHDREGFGPGAKYYWRLP